MLSFEDYKNNLEVTDKNGLSNISVNKSVIYNGHHKIFTYSNKNIKVQPLAATVLGVNNTDIPLPNDVDFHNSWSDMDAQESYLKNKPKSFLILGKQGTGSYSLGEALSKKMNCIHLCPKNVLLDEIDQKSITGQCLDFNMRHNKVCKFNTILTIMKEKLKSPAVQHRGSVISGLPLVTSSKDIKYLLNTLCGEESIFIVECILLDLIFNFKKKKQKKKAASSHSSMTSGNIETAGEGEIEEEQEQESELGIEENEDQIVALPKFLLQPCHDIISPSKVYFSTKKTVLLEQLYELFNLSPDIIISVNCPNSDAILKRSHKYLNYLSSTNTFSNFSCNVENEVRWPTCYTMSDYKKPFEYHIFNPKYNCAQPIHFKQNAYNQICNYKGIVTPFIEQKLKEFDPQFVIKLDGRTSIHEMINHTIEILQFLPFKPVLIPEPLYLEEPSDDIDEFWSKVEELNVIRSGSINFNRYSSHWYNRCPVELKKRQSVQGNPKFAVTFFKHVYLLSSLDAMVSFCRNPRPFLKLEYLEPTCRVITLGTKSSGKTMVAKCLSWIFNAPIICFTSFLKNEKIKKYNNYAKSILSEIIASIEDARFAKWQNSEIERISNLNTWFNTVSSLLTSYVPLLMQKLSMGLEEENTEEENFVFLSKFNSIRNQLPFLPLDELNVCQEALIDKNLLKYAPSHLTIEASKPTIPTLGDEDVTKEIAAYIIANELQKEIEPTPEEIMTEMIKQLQSIDSESDQFDADHVYGKFIIDGFPSDPEYWGYLVDSKLLPDYTISLIENRELDADLLERYIEIEKATKIYQERYLAANDILVKTKLFHDQPSDTTHSDVELIIEGSLKNVLDSIFIAEEKLGDSDLLTSFTEGVERFREDWDVLKLKIDENFKSYIEVELEDKTDIQILDEVLLKLRQAYCKRCLKSEDEADNPEEETETPKDVLTYNDARNLGETNIYCPISYYDYGVLWEGKPEFTAKYDNKIYFLSREECCESLQYDVTKYLSYNKPFKSVPPLRICVIGSIGTGKTTLSKVLAKELGLIHIDFAEFVNTFLIPKHFKKVGWQYENSFTDTLVDDEEIVEFQMDEESANILSDILSNEQELRRLLYNYFERGSPLHSVLVQTLIKKLWYESPYKNTGFVIDGFPKLPNDLEDMLSCFCIPDVLIELEGSSEITLERLSPIRFKNWKLQLNEAKAKAKSKLEAEKREWQNYVTRTIVIKLIIDDILENVVIDNEEPILNLSTQVSTIIDAHPSGSSNVDANLFTTYNDLILEYPEPVDHSEWEKAEDVLERINGRLESIFEIDDENVQTLKDIADEQKIKVISINASRVPVPDERYEFLCEYHKPASKVPAFLNVVDIAGLVRGAAEGQGLGNAFLSHIKACDAIFNLCRAFDDESVIHVDGEVDPLRDLETIGEELRLKDEEQLMQNIEKLDRVVNRGGDKKLKPEYETLTKIKTILVEEKKHIRFGDWSAADIEVLNKYLFLTSKPALYLVNLSEKDYIRKKNKWLPKLKEWIDKNDHGAPLIPFSGALESKLLDMEPDEKQKFLKENGITSALDKIIVQGYKALQLEYFFTAGADEVKAWTIQKGTKAPQAAGRIHTDFEKGFIMAEVMHYKDFKEEGSETACKSAGKYRQQGRNYVVEDGDIIFFKFNAGAGLKDAKKK